MAKDGRVPRRADHAIHARVDGDLVLMSPRDFQYFGAVGAGDAVWELIDGVRDIDGVVDELSARYDAPRARIAEDTAAYLAALAAAGLITWA